MASSTASCASQDLNNLAATRTNGSIFSFPLPWSRAANLTTTDCYLSEAASALAAPKPSHNEEEGQQKPSALARRQILEQEAQYPRFVRFTPSPPPVREMPDRYPRFVQTSYFYDRLCKEEAMRALVGEPSQVQVEASPQTLPPVGRDDGYQSSTTSSDDAGRFSLFDSYDSDDSAAPKYESRSSSSRPGCLWTD